MTIMRVFLSFLLLFFNSLSFAQSELPQLFLFLGGDRASTFQETLQNPCIRGVQIIYSWRQLEPQKGVYDFSKIEEDLNDLSRIDKKLFIQIQDRSFSQMYFLYLTTFAWKKHITGVWYSSMISPEKENQLPQDG